MAHHHQQQITFLNPILLLLILVAISSTTVESDSGGDDTVTGKVDADELETTTSPEVVTRLPLAMSTSLGRQSSDHNLVRMKNYSSSPSSSLPLSSSSVKEEVTTTINEPSSIDGSLVTDLISAPSDTLDSIAPAENLEMSEMDGDESESDDTDLSDDFLFKDDSDDDNSIGGSSFKIPQDAVEFMDYFDDLVTKVKGGLEKIFNKYLPALFEMSSTIVLSPDCTYDVVRILLALREMKPWAIKCKLYSLIDLLIVSVFQFTFNYFRSFIQSMIVSYYISLCS